MKDAKLKLQKLLRRAYSGEMAAALAYSGHWKSLKLRDEIEALKQIEIDEWRHREEIGEILAAMNAKPSLFREVLMFSIGKCVSLSCFLTGRFVSTYFAGVLESGNVEEYTEAEKLARELNLNSFCEKFAEMGETELQHEQILLEMISGHRLLPFFSFFFGWGKPENFVTGSQNVKF